MHGSLHDGLTGLANRRAFDERIAQELARHERYGSSLSVALFDLDGFELANDRVGHAAGDEVLRAVADGAVGISAGAAEASGQALKELLAAADASLYAEKRRKKSATG